MPPPVPWLEEDAPFPAPAKAWGPHSNAPGLLAAGKNLDAATLIDAYRQGIFPWFGAGQPVLWWSPDPRMVLQTNRFKLHPSLRKTLKRFMRTPNCQVQVDRDFARVIRLCAHAPRQGQGGTWIVPDMIAAYERLHALGLAHSIETWWDGQLVGGLYCVAIGRMVFGESMFAQRSNASKIALSALVALCRKEGIDHIDCQQNTAHLASLGAAEMPRAEFAAVLAARVDATPARWHFDPLYWAEIL
jgi:leucyl/phenylalanyl-tRNA---protein transferase